MNMVKLYRLYDQWVELRNTLTGQEKKYFDRWVLKNQPEFREYAKKNPVQFQNECRELMRKTRKETHIGPATLQKYSEELMRAYMQKVTGDGDGGNTLTFEKFVEDIAQKCSNEKALRRMLGIQQ